MIITATKSAAMTLSNAQAEPVMVAKSQNTTHFEKRIGSTTYEVSVRFSKTATETMQDKILRLIESEVDEIA